MTNLSYCILKCHFLDCLIILLLQFSASRGFLINGIVRMAFTSVLEYGNNNVVEIEVEDSVNKCVNLDVKKLKYFCDHFEQMLQSVR